MREEIAKKWPALYKVGFLSLGLFTAFLLAMRGTAIYNVAGAILISSLAFYYYKTKGKLYLPDKQILIAFAVFAIGLILSSLLQGEWINIEASIHYVYFMMNFLIMYVGVRCFGKSDVLCKAITVAAVVTAAFCAIAYFDPNAWHQKRFSPITNPNIAVQFMVLPVSFIIIALCRLRKNKLWLGLNLVSLIVILAAACCTRSRGGIAGLVTGLLAMGAVYWPLLKMQWSEKRKFVVSIIAIGLVSALALLVTVHAFSRTNSDRTRMLLIQSSAQMFMDCPLTGVGYENFSKVFKQYKPPKKKIPNLPTAHNDLFNLLATTGILGAGGYVFFSLVVWIYLLKRMVRQPREGMLWAMMWMFISLYIHGLVDISIQYNNSAKMFFGMLGMTLALADESRGKEEKL